MSDTPAVAGSETMKLSQTALIFGVPIEGEGWDEIMSRVAQGTPSVWVVTANPEILLEARRDRAYRAALKLAGVRAVDGFGLFLALQFSGSLDYARNTLRRIFLKKSQSVLRRKTKRLTGVQLSEHFLQLAWQNKWKVGFLGGEFGEALEAAHGVAEAYPGIEIHVEQGGKIGRDGTEDAASEEARHRMILFGPQILLVAFGHPRQERWIAEHRKDFPELRAVAGIGGTFNFWAGKAKRAPSWMRSVGLEWLWRLIREPRRWKRIWNAVLVFPTLFLIDRIRPIR